MDCLPSFEISYCLVALTDIRLEKAAVPATRAWVWSFFVDDDRVL
jgi:hypothetical protein